jgi:hypothetical protein
MNYLKTYCNLIRKAEERGYTRKKAKELEIYVEGHHTFPVSIFGTNGRIVFLTAREHYIAHALLEKVCIKRYGLYHRKTIKMNFAHNAMKCKNKYINSYLYEKSKIRRTEIIKETGIFDGEKNPFYGKNHSEESKTKMRKSRKNLGVEFLTECGKRGSKVCMEKGIGLFSQTKEDLQRIAKRNQELNIGIFSLTYEQRVENGKNSGHIGGSICKELGKGMFALSPEEKKKHAIKNGKKGGEKNKENKSGIFTLTKEQLQENGRKTNSQRWKCLETGFISTPAGLSSYQRARNIDTSNRIRIS